MKPTLTFYLLFVAFISINAQEYNKYDISNYYTPDIRRNRLDLTFSGHGSYADDEFSRSKRNNYEGEFKASLHHFTHTRKRYSELGGGISVAGSGNKYESENNISKRSYFHPEFSLYTSQRFYNPSNTFISLGGSAKWMRSKNGTFYERINPPGDIEESTEKDSDYRVSAQIGTGKGRLESVEDARQAIYILDNLSKRGVLTRELTDNEIFTLSQLISTVKNKRFFDSRLHLIDEITSVDSFFIANNLLEASNASYFTTLYDYWQHGALFERLSGKEFHSFVSADLVRREYDQYRDDENIFHSENNYNNFYWVNRFSYEKPVNIYWQNSIYTSLMTGYFQQYPVPTQLVDPNKRNMQYSLQGSYSWSYYPNSRTNISAGIYQKFGYIHMTSFEGERTFENGGKFFTSNSSIGGGMNYYISPQLRLSASVSALFDYQKGKIRSTDEKRNYLMTNLSGGVTLTYSIY